MMLKARVPPGEIGKVFGFVSAGLPLGSALTPVPFGFLIDHGHPGAGAGAGRRAADGEHRLHDRRDLGRRAGGPGGGRRGVAGRGPARDGVGHKPQQPFRLLRGPILRWQGLAAECIADAHFFTTKFPYGAHIRLAGRALGRGRDSERTWEMSGTVKISANVSEAVFDALKDTAAKKGVSMTEALRQAISHEKFFQDAIEQGEKLLLEEPKTGRIRQVVIDSAVRPRKA